MNRQQLIRTLFMSVVGVLGLFIVFTVLKRPDPGPTPVAEIVPTPEWV